MWLAAIVIIKRKKQHKNRNNVLSNEVFAKQYKIITHALFTLSVVISIESFQ